MQLCRIYLFLKPSSCFVSRIITRSCTGCVINKKSLNLYQSNPDKHLEYSGYYSET